MFSVTDLKHYAYCPVIIYITHVLGIREEATEYMAYGSEVEKESAVLAVVKATGAIEVLRKMEVRGLGLSGVVDYLLVTRHGEYVPLEVKWSEVLKTPRTDHVLQLASYAMMIEEKLGTIVKVGILYYMTRNGGKVFRITITPELRRRVIKSIEHMRRIIEQGIAGINVDMRKCPNCNYRKYCPIGNETLP
jgi:CRISPR-associated exonuclease Cas4